MIFDLHVHSDISPCSDLPLDDILASARSMGLDGVCITDHDSMAAAGLVRQGVQDDGLVVLVGMEYATAQGDFLVFGDVGDMVCGLDAPDMLAEVRERGGVAVAAHPCRSWRPVDERVFRRELCSLAECVNGRNNDQENRQAEDLADRYPLVRTGGSDAHLLEELGAAFTRFQCPVRSVDDLVQALKNGWCEPGVRQEGGVLNLTACA